jgi:hypothetical protein
MRASRVLLFTASIALLPHAFASCDDHHNVPSDIVIAGDANADGLEALVAATATSDPARSAAMTAPDPKVPIPGGTPPAFSWRLGAGGSDAGVTDAPAGRLDLDRFLLEAFGPERTAHAAHGAPMNGVAYLVTFGAAGNDKLVRVFTTSTTYTPDAGAWDKMKAAGGVTTTITTATFENNRLTPGGGPFVGPAVAFTIQK